MAASFLGSAHAVLDLVQIVIALRRKSKPFLAAASDRHHITRRCRRFGRRDQAPTFSVASRSGESNRWEYLLVVAALWWPNSSPITSNELPPLAQNDA
jgi:hypothetical protein